MKQSGHILLLVVIIAALAATASAEMFYQWTDALGVIHFTNLESAVPTGQAAAQVAVDAVPSQPPAAPVSEFPLPSSNGPLVAGGWSPPPPDSYGSPYAYECAWPDADECGAPYFDPGVAAVYSGSVRRSGAFRGRPFIRSGRMRSGGSSRGRR